MKRLVLTLLALLTVGVSTFASANSAQDLKSISNKLWKGQKNASSFKNQKNELAIVYGGEDVSRRISTEALSA